VTERLARAAAHRPWRTVAVWAIAVILAVVAIPTLLVPALVSEQELTNDPESYRAEQLVFDHFRGRDHVDEIVVIRSERYTVDDPQFRAFVQRLAQRAQATGAIAAARNYHLTGDRSLVSQDRHATMVPIVLAGEPETGVERVIEVVEQADGEGGFDTAMTGTWTIDRDFNELALKDLKEGELFFGAPAALVILVLVFGALVAAGVPLILSIVAILLALGTSGIVAQFTELSIFLQNMVTAVGLALGIDYSLFVLSRYREERANGREKVEAIAAAGATASRAVLFSGSAFVIALVGMLLVPDNIMRSLATGAILVGLIAVAAALTLLPALLSLLGDRVNALRVPILGRAAVSGEREGRFWGRAARTVMRYPVASVVAAVVILLAATIPVRDLTIGFASVSTFPDGYVSKEGLEALERDFRGGQADPVQVVVQADLEEPLVQEAIAQLRDRMRADPRFGPTTVRVNANRDLAVIFAALPGGATDPEPVSAVRDLRKDYIPVAFMLTNARVLVGGETANDVDYFDTMDYWLPIVFTFVLALSFLLLTIAFRSVVVAFKAILLNLLSVGAAYGLLVLVFEKGVGNELFGFTEVESVVAWVPLFLFCILFGLSMDYHVFLLSRIRERFMQTGDNADAVEYGLVSTARLITGAALIIIVVFVGFAMGDLVMFQQMGFGVAVALLIDATVIRSVLVPAAMQLLGRWNWYFPSWLRWLPEVHVGERAQPQPATPSR
jgi:uncharacterized membrane protein YdfJ with MMPL/SSD domain